jgi:ribosomal protein L18E
VSRETLKAKRLIDRSDLPVKILGSGEIQAALTVSVDAASGSAKRKIEAAGGTVTVAAPRAPKAAARKAGASKPAAPTADPKDKE